MDAQELLALPSGMWGAACRCSFVRFVADTHSQELLNEPWPKRVNFASAFD